MIHIYRWKALWRCKPRRNRLLQQPHQWIKSQWSISMFFSL